MTEQLIISNQQKHNRECQVHINNVLTKQYSISLWGALYCPMGLWGSLEMSEPLSSCSNKSINSVCAMSCGSGTSGYWDGCLSNSTMSKTADSMSPMSFILGNPELQMLHNIYVSSWHTQLQGFFLWLLQAVIISNYRDMWNNFHKVKAAPRTLNPSYKN